jgi:amino acid adenylation domain-containing protein
MTKMDASLMEYFEDAKNYWLDRFAGQPSGLQLPPDWNRGKEFQEGWLEMEFPPELAESVARAGKNKPLSMYIVVLTALKIVLYKLTGKRDVVVASPVYKANPQDFNHWVAFRHLVSPEAGFRDILKAVGRTVVEGYKYHYYPLDKLTAAIDGNGPSSLCNIVLTFEDIHEQSIPHEHQVAFDVALDLGSVAGGLGFGIRFDESRFRRQTIRRLAEALLAILRCGLEDPGIPVRDIPLLDQERARELMRVLTGDCVEESIADTLPALVWEAAERFPKARALRMPVDLRPLAEALMAGTIDESHLETLLPCRFRLNPHMFEAPLELTGCDTHYVILKTRQHNSVVVSGTTLEVLRLFDGHHSVKAVLEGLRGNHLYLLLYSVGADDVLELSNRFSSKLELELLDDGRGLVEFMCAAFRDNLLELEDCDWLGTDPAVTLPELEAVWKPQGQERLELLLHRDSDPQPADVLLLGDTPGYSSTGLLYLASYLRRNGVTALCQYSDNSWSKEDLRRNVTDLLDKVKPRVVAFSMKWFLHMARVLEMCRIVKEHAPETLVVVGGNSASYYCQGIIGYDCVDAVIRGDGELPLLQLVRGEENIPNCVTKKKGQVQKNPITYVHNETNGADIYLSHLDEVMLSTYAPVFGIFFIYTQRGCLLDCIYCGGCNRAQRETFNRGDLFLRPAEQVRKDLEAALPYTSTLKFLFDDFSNSRLLEYCRDIWEGIDLSGHFCFITNVVPPSPELVDYVNATFKYVYWNLDLCSLSERHRLELQRRKLVKPQPTDAEIFGFLDLCEQYDNNELIINLIAGLPLFTIEDIEASEIMLDRIMGKYRSFSEFFWARLHAQPGAPVLDDPASYGMFSLARSFEEFLDISRRNFEENEVYPHVDEFYYPYIYYTDEELNSRVSHYYARTNRKIRQAMRSRRELLTAYKDLTYIEMRERVVALASRLRRRGVGAETIVGLMVERGIDMVVGMLAILEAGGAYLPLDPAYPRKRLEFMLADSGAPLVLSHQSLIQDFPYEGAWLALDDPALQEPLGIEDWDRPKGESLAYVIYTSGSTGTPKGVMVEHKSIANTLRWRRDFYQFDQNDTVLQMPSFSFDSSVEDIFTPLISGAGLVLQQQENRFDLPYLDRLLLDNKVSHILVVPNYYRMLLDRLPYRLGRMRVVTVAGDHFSEDLVKRHMERLPHVELVNEYGPTENSVCSTVYRLEGADAAVLIGKPIANSACYLLDADSGLMPQGLSGELVLAGRGIARGYLNRVDMTNERFVPNHLNGHERMYRSGDRGRLEDCGNIRFIGRQDHQVKIRGFRIEAGEIERCLLEFDGVAEAAVTVKERENQEKYLCGYFVVATDVVGQEELREYLADRLPEYMIPAHLLRLDAMPLTPGGKVDRNNLPEPDDVLGQETIVPPADEVEEKLANVWAEVLQLDAASLSVEANFFELGGHSLRAMTLIGEMEKVFEVSVPLAKVFNAPTVRQLALYLKGEIGNQPMERYYNADFTPDYQYPIYFDCFLGCIIEKLRHEENYQLERHFALLSKGGGINGYVNSETSTFEYVFLLPFGTIFGMTGIMETLGITYNVKTFASLEEQLRMCREQLEEGRLVFVSGSTYFLHYTPDYKQDKEEFLRLIANRPLHTMHSFLLVDVVDNDYLIYDPNFDFFGLVPGEEFHHCLEGLPAIDFLRGHSFLEGFESFQMIDVDFSKLQKPTIEEYGRDILQSHIDIFTGTKIVEHTEEGKLYRVYAGLNALRTIVHDLRHTLDVPGNKEKLEVFLNGIFWDLFSSLTMTREFFNAFVFHFPYVGLQDSALLESFDSAIARMKELGEQQQDSAHNWKDCELVDHFQWLVDNQETFYDGLNRLLDSAGPNAG